MVKVREGLKRKWVQRGEVERRLLKTTCIYNFVYRNLRVLRYFVVYQKEQKIFRLRA
jgi:hypothetical protein